MRFPSRTLALTFGALTLGALLSLPVVAQDTQGMVDRLNRLERDLNTLQAQVYRGGGGKPSSGGSGDSSLNGNAYSVLDNRISELEERLRDATGEMEKNQNLLSQLQSKLDRMQQDSEFRFKQIEDKQNAAGAPPAGGPPPGADVAPTGNQQGPGSPPGFLGHPADKGAAAAPPPPAAGGAGLLPVGKTAAEQYDYARGLLQNSDYDGASGAFKAFVQQHPQDPLAGSAAYWLGQIAYVQGHYDQAAVIFLDTYQKYPKSAHVAESLLKVGLSMGQLGKKKEACAALHRFQTEFPDASDSLKKQASSERAKQGC